jgi:glycosyltransferase involved in cell wall biosynthesis
LLKIAYFILNNFDFDSRARLEVEALGQMGHNVEIIATTGSENLSYHEFYIHRIPQWWEPTRKFRFLQYNFLAARIGKKIKADIYHAIDLDTLQAAIWAARKNNARVIYEARELYTELEAVANRPIIKSIWRFLERQLIGKANKIITINNSIADELCSRYHIERPTVIRNTAVVPEKLQPVDFHARFNILGDTNILLYQGVLRKGQGLLYLLKIMKLLEKAVLIFIGAGPLEHEIRRQVWTLGISDKVKFVGRVPPDELANYTAGGDIGLLLMEDVALNNKLALPQKLFQYLAAGIPQVVSPLPELTSFVETEQTGITIPLQKPDIAARLIFDFLSNKKKYQAIKNNCLKSAIRNSWQEEVAILKQMYQDLELSS